MISTRTEVPEWLTVDEACAYLKVSRRSLYRWCDRGRLPYYELEGGGHRRFNRQDLDRLLKLGGSQEEVK
ncbi:MAG: helix-turn-helix domain-containing protein [Candidatus Dormibacteraceae bacterium]